MPWKQRALARSPAVRRSQQRSIDQAREIIDAANVLMFNGDPDFTVQRLITEAGIALQTFYRYFSGKDELLLAVLEEQIEGGVLDMAATASLEPDPLSRLRSIIVQVLTTSLPNDRSQHSRILTHQHFRLQEQYPNEVEDAVRPYVDLLLSAIDECTEAGLIDPLDRVRDAWTITNTVLAIHHNASVGAIDLDPEASAEHCWHFCLCGLRGTPAPVAKTTRTRSAATKRRPVKA